MIFQACRNSSSEFIRSGESEGSGAQEKAYLHQKYINHIITELKPVLAEIIRQGIAAGDIRFDDAEALAEIVLIVLTVKMDDTLAPASREQKRTDHPGTDLTSRERHGESARIAEFSDELM